MTWGQFTQWLTEQLSQRDNGINEARWLVEAMTGLPFYTLREQPFEAELRPKFEAAVTELAQGRPFQYVIGSQEFFGLTFHVREGVLVPRPETELLTEVAIQWGRGRNIDALDLCTGSGCIAITLSKRLQGTFTAVDLSSEALTIAKENNDLLGASVDFRQGDLFSPVIGETFDLITANPPYLSEKEMSQIPVELTYEPSLALVSGRDGLDLCRLIINEVNGYLRDGGLFLMEFGETQGLSILKLMKPLGWHTVEIRKDYNGKDRFLYAIK